MFGEEGIPIPKKNVEGIPILKKNFFKPPLQGEKKATPQKSEDPCGWYICLAFTIRINFSCG